MIRSASFFSHYRFTVAASASLDVPITGAFFYCTESSAQFEMNFGDSGWFKMEAGIGFRLQPPDGFQRLTFRNLSATEVLTIQFYAGVGEIVDGRITTIQDRVVQVYQKVFPTRVVGHDDQPIGVDSTHPYLIQAAARAQLGESRKQVIVANLSNDKSLYVRDSDGFIISRVMEKAVWTIDTSDDLQVTVGGTNDAIEIAVCEIFYRRL